MEAKRDEEECKHVCRLCNKKYPSGKSLGGHMRSHVITNSYVPLHKLKSKKAFKAKKVANLLVSGAVGSSSEKEVSYKAIALINSFSIENGSSSNKSEIDTEVEDVALCLMMLSGDSSHKRSYLECESNELDSSKSKLVFDDSVDGYVRNCVIKNPKVEYKCSVCPKQALGGHSLEESKLGSNGDTKKHCCPLCSKVFRSGQALGGHKRSHSEDKANPVQFIEHRNRPLLIDLNLPASLD